jgi:hypothetical protein
MGNLELDYGWFYDMYEDIKSVFDDFLQSQDVTPDELDFRLIYKLWYFIMHYMYVAYEQPSMQTLAMYWANDMEPLVDAEVGYKQVCKVIPLLQTQEKVTIAKAITAEQADTLAQWAALSTQECNPYLNEVTLLEYEAFKQRTLHSFTLSDDCITNVYMEGPIDRARNLFTQVGFFLGGDYYLKRLKPHKVFWCKLPIPMESPSVLNKFLRDPLRDYTNDELQNFPTIRKWRQDMEPIGSVTVDTFEIHAIETVRDDGIYRLVIKHVLGFHGKGFVPSIQYVRTDETKENLDCHYMKKFIEISEADAYHKAVEAGNSRLQYLVEELHKTNLD